MISENVATRADVKELDHKIDRLDAKFSIELHKMVNKLGITVVASVSALGVFLKFF